MPSLCRVSRTKNAHVEVERLVQVLAKKADVMHTLDLVLCDSCITLGDYSGINRPAYYVQIHLSGIQLEGCTSVLPV